MLVILWRIVRKYHKQLNCHATAGGHFQKEVMKDILSLHKYESTQYVPKYFGNYREYVGSALTFFSKHFFSYSFLSWFALALFQFILINIGGLGHIRVESLIP